MIRERRVTTCNRSGLHSKQGAPELIANLLRLSGTCLHSIVSRSHDLQMKTAQIGKPVAGILVLAVRGVERVIEQWLDLGPCWHRIALLKV